MLVDITPDELIQRLNEGKVYVPETARRATQNFFTAGNLTALRELALAPHRRPGRRPDGRLSAPEGDRGPVGDLRAAARLRRRRRGLRAGRAARRRSSRPRSTPPGRRSSSSRSASEETTPAKARRASPRRFGLAERLGGDTTRLQGSDFPGEILRLARRENMTQIVLGQSRAGLLAAPARPLAAGRDRAPLAGPIEVHVVPHEESRAAGGALPEAGRRFAGAWRARSARRSAPSPARSCVGEALTHGAAAAEPVDDLSRPRCCSAACASARASAVHRRVRCRSSPTISSSSSRSTHSPSPQPQELFALLIFLVVAVLTGSLAGRVRDQRESVIKNADITQSLYDFSRKLSGALERRRRALGGGGASARDASAAASCCSSPEGDELQTSRRLAARRAARRRRHDAPRAGPSRRASRPAGAPARCRTSISSSVRCVAARGPIARLRLRAAIAGRADLAPTTSARSTSILDQTAIALDRALLAREAVEAPRRWRRTRRCATRCSPRSRTICARRLSSIAGAATVAARARRQDERRTSGTSFSPRSRRRRRGCRASSPTSSTCRASRRAASRSTAIWSTSPTSCSGAVERSRKAFPEQPVRGQPRARSAVRPRRRQAARAGAVQSARQRAQIWRRQRRRHPRRARRATTSSSASPTRGPA